MASSHLPPELPPGWVVCSLNDITEIILGQSPPSSTYNKVGEGLPFYQGKADFNEVYPTPKVWCTEPGKIAEKDDVLISVRAPVGPTNLAPDRSCIGRGLAALRPLGGMEPRFILYMLRAYEGDLASQGTGSTFTAISGDILRRYQVPLPPLAEQRRIMGKIAQSFSSLEIIEDELDKTQPRADLYWKSILREAIKGDISKSWRKRVTVPEWRHLPIGDLGDWSGGGTPSRDTSEYWAGGTIPWASSGDIKKPWLSDTEEKITKKGLMESSAKLMPSNSLLIVTRSGILRRVLPVTVTVNEMAINQDIKGLIPKRDLNPDYILFALLALEDDIRAKCMKEGTTVESIQFKELMKYVIPVPSIEEQTEIVKQIRVHLIKKETVAEEIEKSKRFSLMLRQSVLNRAFEGKLVPQDPNDEPASVLLERIKVERTKSKGRQAKLT